MKFVNHLVLTLLVSVSVYAGVPSRPDFSNLDPSKRKPGDPVKLVLANLNLLEKAGIESLKKDASLGVGVATLSASQERLLSAAAHEDGICGGFEALSQNHMSDAASIQRIFTDLRLHSSQMSLKSKSISVSFNPELADSLSRVDANALKSSVEWLTSFGSRYHAAAEPNRHVEALKQKLFTMIQSQKERIELDMISHSSTRQKSLRLRWKGRSKSEEIVVIGAHLDSIVSWGYGSKAPGADDDASGSSNLIEIVRVLVSKNFDPQRTIDFFWYAGEEAGLLGSAEIAAQYKQENKDVVGVMQLDMTLYPGSSRNTVGLMSDFTSASLGDYLKTLAQTYSLPAKFVADQCGYGCSDHASWHRRGFPTVMPFEATFRQMNQNIHTDRDVISSTSDFEHSKLFAQLGLGFVYDLSTQDGRPL